MTLSHADLRWNGLAEVIWKVNRLGLSLEDIENMNYFEKCHLLNKYPIIVARHFQYRVEVFFKDLLQHDH